jgi:hypothetical protein
MSDQANGTAEVGMTNERAAEIAFDTLARMFTGLYPTAQIVLDTLINAAKSMDEVKEFVSRLNVRRRELGLPVFPNKAQRCESGSSGDGFTRNGFHADGPRSQLQAIDAGTCRQCGATLVQRDGGAVNDVVCSGGCQG